ncbi:uncharacterized protein J4E78_004798 [Alternaria triticimaculans]|uniref:uncharacterized protein n=1 Tax=Alternaria triticimaculans TaxID=297637 RepID=UPI0020C3F929|nr:uncharacterized protein J4E78_004798 [Alternaria triticimaculans]KAI4662007.1 hypothetical protein J4E78_004798 [Alternaria triticimaculans]
MANQEPEIWIGYTKNGRNYLDKQAKALNTEQQTRYLSEFYMLRFSVRERVMLRWLWCQRPVIQICEVMTANAQRCIFPLEVHFEDIETSHALSAALLRPGLLRESGRMFHETGSFDVENTEASPKRKVLCIGHVVDKRYLVWPLALSFAIATVVAVIAGIATRSVSSGAELGGFIGVGVVLSWSYILWLLG